VVEDELIELLEPVRPLLEWPTSLFVLFDWRVGKGSISFKPLSFLALDGLFDPPFLLLAIFPGIKLRQISFRSRFECCIGLGGGGFGFGCSICTAEQPSI
jgi:hypothetical protein